MSFKKLLPFTSTLSFLTTLDNVVLAAQDSGGTGGAGIDQNPSLVGLITVIERIFLFLIGIVGAFAVTMIIVGGIRYILASGDEKATAAAKATITFAIVGLVIVLLSVFIVNFLGSLFGAGDLANIRIGV